MTLAVCHVQIGTLVGDTKRVSCTVLIFGKFTTPEINTQNIFTWKMILNLRLSLNFHCLDRAKCYFQAWGSTKDRHEASAIARGQSGEGPLGSDRLVFLGLL